RLRLVEFGEQLGVLVEQAEQVHDSGKRPGLATFITAERGVSSAGKPGSGPMREPQPLAYDPQHGGVLGGDLRSQRIAGCRVALAFARVELDLTAAWAVPAGDPLHQALTAPHLNGEVRLAMRQRSPVVALEAVAGHVRAP